MLEILCPLPQPKVSDVKPQVKNISANKIVSPACSLLDNSSKLRMYPSLSLSPSPPHLHLPHLPHTHTQPTTPVESGHIIFCWPCQEKSTWSNKSIDPNIMVSDVPILTSKTFLQFYWARHYNNYLVEEFSFMPLRHLCMDNVYTYHSLPSFWSIGLEMRLA